MGLVQDLYYRIARRGIGGLLGMKWEPDRDMGYQRAWFMRKVSGQLEHLNTAKGLLEKGDIQRAGAIAYRTFGLFPYAIVPGLVEAHELANEIIARLPEDYLPPEPEPPAMSRRIAADKVAAHITEARKLADGGKYAEALTLLRDDTGIVHIFTHGGVHKIDMVWELGELSDAIQDKLDQAAKRA